MLVEDIVGEFLEEAPAGSSGNADNTIREIIDFFSDLYEHGDSDVQDLLEIGFRPHLEGLVESHPRWRKSLTRPLVRLLGKNLPYWKSENSA